MRKKIRLILSITVIVIICFTCKKDDDWYHINAYEENLYHYVNEYRQSQGKSLLNLQPVMVVEAQGHSKDWRESGDPVTGLQERFETVIEKLGGTNYGVITMIAYGLSPDSVVNTWIADSTANAIMLNDYTQSGPGISEGDGNSIYITHMFLFIP